MTLLRKSFLAFCLVLVITAPVWGMDGDGEGNIPGFWGDAWASFKQIPLEKALELAPYVILTGVTMDGLWRKKGLVNTDLRRLAYNKWTGSVTGKIYDKYDAWFQTPINIDGQPLRSKLLTRAVISMKLAVSCTLIGGVLYQIEKAFKESR